MVASTYSYGLSDFTADDILNKGQRPAGKGNTTRPSGQPVPSENTSVTAGQQGPVSMQLALFSLSLTTP